MSTEILFAALKAKIGNPTQKIILIQLVDMANEYDQCWPSHQYLADRCEINRSTVIRHIAVLEKRGLIHIQARSRKEGKNSNLYTINTSALLALNAKKTSDTMSPPSGTVPLPQPKTSGTAPPPKRQTSGTVPPPKRQTSGTVPLGSGTVPPPTSGTVQHNPPTLLNSQRNNGGSSYEGISRDKSRDAENSAKIAAMMADLNKYEPR